MLREPQNYIGKDLMGIAMAYSKTQNFSQEFIYIFEQSVSKKIEELSPREIATIIHTFYKNNYYSKKNLDHIKILLEDPQNNTFINRFSSSDIANLVHAFAYFKFWELDDQIKDEKYWSILLHSF